LLIEIQQTHLSFYILLPLLSVNTTQEELVAKEKKKKKNEEISKIEVIMEKVILIRFLGIIWFFL
jgi:hypothetical protein